MTNDMEMPLEQDKVRPEPPDFAAGQAGAPPLVQSDETGLDERPDVGMNLTEEILARLSGLEHEVGQMTASVTRLGQQVELIPPQVRLLMTTVNDTVENISHPRLREMLDSLLTVHDLVEGMLANVGSAPEHATNYQIVLAQLDHILDVNGIQVIPDLPTFDPSQQRAIDTRPCHTPEEDGEIVQTSLHGFRTQRAVLRYAHVIVKRYIASEQNMETQP